MLLDTNLGKEHKTCDPSVNLATWGSFTMPTLEVLKLQLKAGISHTSPQLLAVLTDVRAFVKTGSRFYTCIEDNSLLYVLGEWPSLAAHKSFLSSPDRERVLKPQEDVADFVWCIHADIPGHVSEVLPLDAPVLAFARVWIKPDQKSVESFTRLVDKYREEIAMGSSSENVFNGWRSDVEEDQKECVMITGWDSKARHFQWTETMRRDVPEYGGLRKHYDTSKHEGGMEVVHLKDIEKRESDS